MTNNSFSIESRFILNSVFREIFLDSLHFFIIKRKNNFMLSFNINAFEIKTRAIKKVNIIIMYDFFNIVHLTVLYLNIGLIINFKNTNTVTQIIR